MGSPKEPTFRAASLSCDLNSDGANCERRERQQRAANATCWQQEPAELHPEQGRGSRG